MALFSASPADQRLLPEGRLAGPMPWVIAIMMVLTVLAAAAGLSLGNAAALMERDLEGRLTIQIAEPQPALRESLTARILTDVRNLSAVGRAAVVPEQEIVALLDPWLGKDGLEADLPLPAMIDVEMVRALPQDIASVKSAVQSVSPAARVDPHSQWLGPLSGLITSLKWLTLLLVVLMTVATSATVVLSARAALNTHLPTIEIMHLLGATDVQVARLFQRRIALDALFGGVVGLLIALVIIALIGQRVGAIGSDLLGSARLDWMGWVAIAALPLLGAIVSTLAARFTVLRALRQSL